MSKSIAWKFSQPLSNANVLDDFEIDYCFKMEPDFKEFIKKNNAAYPSPNAFDKPCKDLVFSNLLSFNKEDDESVYSVINLFVKNGKLTMLPFATDGFGNMICIKGKQILFWNHENGNAQIVADSLGTFLQMLHE